MYSTHPTPRYDQGFSVSRLLFSSYRYSTRNISLNSAVTHLGCMLLWKIAIVFCCYEIEVKAKHI